MQESLLAHLCIYKVITIMFKALIFDIAVHLSLCSIRYNNFERYKINCVQQ